MTSSIQPETRFQPRFPAIVATVVFVVAALTLFWPMLSGQFLAGSDQVMAGYAFRAFAAHGMQTMGHIPQWNPFIFGGMPLWAVPGHFDVFYPTAWLRWILSADVALTLSFFLHYIVAGIAMYSLLRTLGGSWTASVVSGLAYELSGILASQVSPGHDGKLYAAALAPFAFVALLRAIRHGNRGYFGWFAIVIGLVMLTPHYLAAYYLLVASALFTLWLVFLDPERDRAQSPWIPLALAVLAVIVGLSIAMIELLPVQHMVAFTARAAGGESTGYAYASSWGMAPQELMTSILPQFNGMLDHYWGPNHFKDHTEYLGGFVVALALIGIPAARRRRLLLPLGVIGVLFLLVSFGGYTSFYHLWYMMPRMGQFRAPGLAFYVVALVVCVLAGLGIDDVIAGLTRRAVMYAVFGVLAFIAILAAGGVLQGVAESLVDKDYPALVSRVVDNASDLQFGGIRLLVALIAGGVAVLLIRERKLVGIGAAAALLVVVGADNWSILRNFPKWLPPARITFADDPLTTAMKKSPMPFRAYTPSAPDADPQTAGQMDALQVYKGAQLMARGVPTLLGYHGMESRYFDGLLGGKNVWSSQFAANIQDLYAVKYIALTSDVPQLRGYHKIAGPIELGDITRNVAPQGVLFERDSAITWVRVVPALAKVPEDQIAGVVTNDRFPINSYVVVPDTSKVNAPTPGAVTPEPATVTASLASWTPGAIHVTLAGKDARTTYLLVSENWYPDWHATVDGRSADPIRGDGAMLTVELPPGARDVTLRFDVASYHEGKWVTLLALLAAVGLLFSDRIRPRSAAHG